MGTAVVIPYRAGEPARERALDWVTARYRDAFPDVDIILGDCNPDLPFNRSEAILDGASKTTADTLIVSDGDVWTDGLPDALQHVERTGWAIPHLMLCRLSEASTERVLAGENPEDQDDFAERPYKGFECGTVFVIRRDVLFDVPPDVRFVGWGGEESSLALALHSLVGKPWRGRANCYHLHHPPQPRKNRGVGNDANLALYRRYRSARNDPARMRALVAEAQDCYLEILQQRLDGMQRYSNAWLAVYREIWEIDKAGTA